MGALGLLEAFRDKASIRQYSRPTFAFILNGYVTRFLCVSLESITHLQTGNLAQTFDPQGWEFHKNLVDTFGGVTKLQGFPGVSSAGVLGSMLALI